MPDSPRPDPPRTARPPACAARQPGGSVLGPDPLRGLAPLLRAWLPGQRWFSGRDRPITGLRPAGAVELPAAGRLRPGPGLLHLLLDVEQCGGPVERYQLLLGLRPAPPPVPAGALVGRVASGPLAGLTAYEALADPGLAGLLLERLRSPGRAGPLRFATAPGARIPAGLTPRLSGAEQSNSSVIYGDAFILKVFRRVAAGTNPDLEVTWALARAGCPRVAAPAAWFEALGGGEPATLGVLQRFLPEAEEGWALALRAVDRAAGPDGSDGSSGPDRPAGGEPDFAGAARELGAATAEVHSALARTLPHEVLSAPQIAGLAASMADRLTAAVRQVPELVRHEAGLRAAYRDLAELAGDGTALDAQRIHGDLHLGQVLRTERAGWVLIDFEGEPARPLAERRRPQPVARDVAGMLRSFDYAARHRDPASPRADAWAERQRSAFCEGYARAAGRDPRDAPVPLRAYETDKAVYEVVYEAAHRPRWLPIPMAAVRRLAAAPRRGRP